MENQISLAAYTYWRIVLGGSQYTSYLDKLDILDASYLLDEEHLLTHKQKKSIEDEVIDGEEFDPEASWHEFEWSEKQRTFLKSLLDQLRVEWTDLLERRGKLFDLMGKIGIAGETVWSNTAKSPSLVAEILMVAGPNSASAFEAIFPSERRGGESTGLSAIRLESREEFIDRINAVKTKRNGIGPRDDEDLDTYIRRCAVDNEKLEEAARTFRMFGGNLSAVASYLDQRNGAPPHIEWIVEGLLPRAALSVLVGAPKIGKSTLALQASLHVASGESAFGQVVPNGKGLVLFISGEDSEAVAIARLTAMLGDKPMPERLVVDCRGGPLSEILARYDDANVDFVVIDTAARFIEGSLSDGGHVRNFMSLIDTFLKNHNAAGLVIHHVNKGDTPRSAQKVIRQMKGSGEFLSAARVIWTFYEGQAAQRTLQVGVDNMPASAPTYKAPIRLGYDRTSEIHSVIETQVDRGTHAEALDASTTNIPLAAIVPVSDEDAHTVARVIHRAIAEGRVIALSGNREPFNLKAAELGGWPRTRVRRAHARAVEMGLIATGGAATEAAE